MNPFERLREIVTALGLSSGDSDQMWFDGSNPVCLEAERMLRAGRAAEAEAAFQRILTEPRHAALAKKHLPRILLALAEAQIRQEKWEAAEQTGARAWALLSELRYRASPEFAECCRLRAQAAKGRGALEEALLLSLQGLAAVEEQKHPRPAEIVRRRIEAAALLRELKRVEEAEQQAAKAVEHAAKHAEGSRYHGDALLEWALCLAANERFAEAREAGERAAKIQRAACGDFSGEVALVYEKLGAICQQQGDYPAAVAYLEKALNVKEHQVGGDSSEFALLLVALADLYTLIGRLAPALELLQQAVGKLGPSRDSNLAGALEKLAAMYVRTGRYEDAADCYQRAFDFWSGDPAMYAERITANRQAVESLLPWLPEPETPSVQEAPDPGISVLRPDRQPGEPSELAAAPVPGGLPLGNAAPGGVPLAAQAGAHAPPYTTAGQPMQALPGPAPIRSAAAPGGRLQTPRVEASDWLQPALPAPAATPAPGSVPATQATSPVQASPAAPQAQLLIHNAAGAGSPGSASLAASLSALNASVSVRRDANGFCGWEDLEFEPLHH